MEERQVILFSFLNPDTCCLLLLYKIRYFSRQINYAECLGNESNLKNHADEDNGTSHLFSATITTALLVFGESKQPH